MKRLSRESQSRAAAFLGEQARPLENALFAFHFENGPADAVLAELAPFQNPDGGFGSGLEPDLRTSASSALATTVGLQILREVGAPSEHSLVRGAVGHLLDTLDAENQVWPIITPATQDAPHAPWWNYTDDIAAQWGGFKANPTAEIVGYLHEHAALVPAELRDRLTLATVDHLENSLEELVMHDLLCYLRLAESPNLPGDVYELILPMLRTAVERLTATDPEQWSGYSLRPLDVARTPASPFAARLESALDSNLDYAIDQQCEDGSWPLSWTWGDSFPEVWPQAEREWKGVRALRTLETLKNFDRLT